MRTIGVFIVALILFPSFLLQRTMENVNNSAISQDNTFRFHIPVTKLPALITGTKKKADIDTNDIKQSSWYANAIKQIEENEYEIKLVDKSTEFASPNRRQNLRAFYTADKFSLEPRADDSWKLQLTVKGIYSGKKKIYSPQENVLAATAKNKIQFNHNNKFAVEYINSKEGVRQNFIIQKQPASQLQTINIKLQTNNGWFINKVHDKELNFAKIEGDKLSKKITYNSLKVWDANNKELDASFSVNKNEISINVNTEKAVYPITVDPLSTTPATILNGISIGDQFGWSVASAGDVNRDGYSDMIVGARGVSTSTGAAYIFLGSSTGLSTSPATILNGLSINDFFGYSVASSGDVNGDGYSDVIVGSPGVSTSTGAAYIFLGSSTGLSSSPATILNGLGTNNSFGSSVACTGDVNGDSYSDVIVGAQGVSTFTGAAYVYLGSNTGLSSSPATILNGFGINNLFGESVASAGDINGDGYSDVVVGAPGLSSSTGAAYVFHGSNTGLSVSPSTTLNGLNTNDWFGVSVASAGDVNGDGYSDVVVGAFGVTTQTGAAYIFHGSSTVLSALPATILNGVSASGLFGVSVNCAGDINGDGFSDVIVGARGVSTSTGAAYIFLGSNTGLSASPSTTLNGITINNFFGFSVATAGDINGDGYSDLVVGADGVSSNTGAAYTYHGGPDGLTVSASITRTGISTGDYFGVSVASAGDINGDGFSDVIVGSEKVSTNTGAAYIFLGNATGLPSSPTSTLNGTIPGGYFGHSVACAGDVNGDGFSDVIIGAFQANSLKGSASLYLGSALGLSSPPSISLNGVANGDQFGVSVASAGDVNGDGYGDVIIGAYGVNSNQGAFYIYWGSSSGLSASSFIIRNDINNVNNDAFGISVASAGDVNGDGYSDVLAGAYGVTSFTGAAYLYLGGPVGLSSSPSTTLSGLAAGNSFGISVAVAGDVNGDGYSDVIIGAHEVNFLTGAAYIFLGSSSGLSSLIATTLNGITTSDYFGKSVASAGDVNGDGYSDVIVGAYLAPSGSAKGAAYVFLGNAAGLTSTPSTTLSGISLTNFFGNCVACVGDINGDGYSDVAAGAPGVSSLQGASYFYYGNSTAGLRNNLFLYNSDLVTPIQQSNMADPNLFGAGIYAKSFIGRQKGKMVWETVWNGQPFSGNPITNSVTVTASQPTFSNLGLTGTELKYLISKRVGHKATYLRARVKYDLVTAITGQVYGPWRYPESFLRGKRDIGSVALPVKFISFNVVKKDMSALLKWITVDEERGVRFEIQHSTNGISFTSLTAVNGSNQTRNEYEWLHVNPAKGNNFYRIKAVENQKEVFTNTKILNFSDAAMVSIFPNPAVVNQALSVESVSIKLNQPLKISCTNSAGQLVWQNEITATTTGRLIFNFPAIPGGAYLLQVQAGQWTDSKKIIVADW
ncbi:MAG: FG-GAP repeat protein [Chitinophagaceae bacterium]|nr:FG-GAP repeat protein [Chitinophagaceae bacterium]